MAINLQIQKKDLWLLVAIIVFVSGSVYVIAIGSGDPTLHGHDASEIVVEYTNCYWTTGNLYHQAGVTYQEICPEDCIMRGIRTTEPMATWEDHRIYCCCK